MFCFPISDHVMLLEGMSSYARANVRINNEKKKKQKENSHEGITWSEMGTQNIEAEVVF